MTVKTTLAQRVAAAVRTSTLNTAKLTGSQIAITRRAAPSTLPGSHLASRISSGNTSFTSGVSAGVQARFAHIDVPTFNDYRREPAKDEEDGDYSRRTFTYVLGAGGAIGATHMAKNLVQDFLDTMSASADVLALAKMEVDLSNIPEGKNVTFKWRGKPVFVRHRTKAEIDEVRAVDVKTLRHKESDEERAPRPEWLVVLGICTHLGCVPIANAGEYNGYFCPCHGSHYDASGRIRKGPAPENLEIPEHSFSEEGDRLVIG